MVGESQAAFLDYDDVPRQIVALRTEMSPQGGYEHPAHSHRRAQVIFATRGFVTCNVKQGLWMVAPECALWIPGGMEHSVRVVGQLELFILYVDPGVCADMPRECCTLTVNPLLRELLIATADLPRLYDVDGPEGRLIQTMLDQLTLASLEQLHLPMPTDPRLHKIAEQLTAAPDDRATIGEWAQRIGMSERSLNRLIAQQTGMSFGRWRQQFQIMFALKRMAEGGTIKSIAYELGYETASAFIMMFRKALGQSPARYYASRKKEQTEDRDHAPALVL